MNAIKFSHNWNGKLGPLNASSIVSGSKIFTTIRKSEIKKNGYYGERLGEVFNIVLKNQIIGKAKLKDIWSSKFSEINPPLLMLDTGYTDSKDIEKLFNSFKIGKDDRVLVLVFEKI
jgi:hypothetical protein